ncbi:MAG: 3TM-type holin [Minisyncoccia bacterium]
MVWTALIGPVASILDKFIEDKDKKNELAHEIATMAEKHAHEANLIQAETNKEEAQHRSVWVAGWRPFIGWVCGFALAWHFVLSPVVLFFAAWFNIVLPALPAFDMGSLMTVLMGMLGLGGLRTFEKTKGLTR